MEFEISNDDDIKIVLKENGEIKAKGTCYYKNTPIEDNEHIGCIGEFEANYKEYGIELLRKCEQIFKEKNIKKVVAPMNGNTWRKYRTMKFTNGDDTFLLENVNPITDNEIFLTTGYTEKYTYTSNKGLVENAYISEALSIAEENLKLENIKIRKFNKEKATQDLEKIYNISKQSFTKNPYYTPISKEEFLKQYEPYINMVDEDMILIAEKEEKEIGFVFCIPNFNEIKQGKKLETLILKTIAILPEYEEYALGNVLLKNIAVKAKEKGFINWIFAFMYSNNTSQKMAKRNNAEVIREYALYEKELR